MANDNPKDKKSNGDARKNYSVERPEPKTPRPKLPKVRNKEESNQQKSDD